MASVQKIVDKMKRQPNGITPDEADKVLEHYRYRFARQKGSHKSYINENGVIQVVPQRRPTIKSTYIKQILAKIEE